MKKIKVVIFDCDGVMFDSKQANIEFYNHILRQFDRPPLKSEEVEYVHINTAERSLNYLFKGDPRVKEAQAYRLTLDYTPFIPYMTMEPHLLELLKYLRPLVKMAISTNRSTTIGQVLKHHGLTPYFDLVISALDVTNPKPHPESILKILDHFQASPEEVCYIGDSLIDQEVAEKSGVVFLAYKNRSLKAHYYLDDLREVKGIIGKDR